MRALLEEAAARSAAGESFVLATVVWRRAPSSGRSGSKALVLPDGTVRGWVGGACAQPTLVKQAREVLADGRPRLVFLGPADDREGVLRDGVTRVPMACESEGALEIYLEPVLPAPRVVVVGESPMVSTLATLVGGLGWSVSVVDEAGFSGDARTAVVVATQGRWDEAAVQAALATEAPYVGLVASRRRAAAVVEWLRSSGVPASSLARLHAPAGLDLGAVDHEEIAVAVLAELVSLRASGGLRAAPGGPAEAMAEEATDPVCGMTVDVEGARHVSDWNGAKVYFCAASCKRAFDENPDKYADALA